MLLHDLEHFIHAYFCRFENNVHGWAHSALARGYLRSLIILDGSPPTLAILRQATVVANYFERRLSLDIAILVAQQLACVGDTEFDLWTSNFTLPESWLNKSSKAALLALEGLPAMVPGIRLSMSTFLDVLFGESLLTRLIAVWMDYCGNHCTSPRYVTHKNDTSESSMTVKSFLARIPTHLILPCTCGRCLSHLYHIHTHLYLPRSLHTSYFCDSLRKTLLVICDEAEDLLDNILRRLVLAPRHFTEVRHMDFVTAFLDVIACTGQSADGRRTNLRQIDAQALSYLFCSTSGRLGSLNFGVTYAEIQWSNVWDFLGHLHVNYDFEARSAGFPPIAFFTTGGWLHCLTASDGRDGTTYAHFLLSSTRDIQLLCARNVHPEHAIGVSAAKWQAAAPLRSPPRHTGNAFHSLASKQMDIKLNPCLYIVFHPTYSWGATVVYPMFHINFEGRLIETSKRPYVKVGHRCEHKHMYQVGNRCSTSSFDVLRQILISEGGEFLDFAGSGGYAQTQFMLGPNEGINLRHLCSRGGLLEKGKIVIVRHGPIDGPVEPIVILSAKLFRKVYVIHPKECWDCATIRMLQEGYTVGLAENTIKISSCDDCDRAASNAESIKREEYEELCYVWGTKFWREEVRGTTFHQSILNIVMCY